jgi:DNA adenine methylase
MAVTTLCRYPGGKTKLARPILERLHENPNNDYREPFFGGGAIGIRMMMTSNSNCWFNDLDPTVCALWQAVANHSCELKQAISEFVPSVDEFRRIKSDFLTGAATSSSRIVRVARDKLALQAMSFSGLGVRSHSPVGGWAQHSPAIASRWLPESLCKRIDLISPHFARARVTNLDFTSMLSDDACAAIYLDPPYYRAGPELYQHSFSPADHLRLRDLLRHTGHTWLLSYDDCPAVRELYSFAHIEEVEVTYSVSKSRRTRELLISPRHRSFIAFAMAA